MSKLKCTKFVDIRGPTSKGKERRASKRGRKGPKEGEKVERRGRKGVSGGEMEGGGST